MKTAKNEERESKTARKMAQVRERGGVGKKGRKRLQTNPRILKTAHLACHAWVRAPTCDAVNSCHNRPIKYNWPQWSGKEDACAKPKEFFMERVNGELSMNPNDHCLISNLDWVTMLFSIAAIRSSKFGSVNHYPRAKKTLTTWAQHDQTLQKPSHSLTKENRF